ncbi:MAG: hypothetical protein H6576_06500 [Lewinellaceae bacterium]|nr:hypothetical protein [Saprospiraceae bacterium]MCB0541041.1 hypothetical protein [Bacteroidota bacterium]MCB9343327.1 hypothetical protein [Lewinellaceae bacterium]
MNIFVAKLNFETNEDSLRAAFEEFGEVESVMIIHDKLTQRSKGFGFVEMANEDDGIVAIGKLNATEIDGRTIVVKKAEPRQSSRGGRFSHFGGFGKEYRHNRGYRRSYDSDGKEDTGFNWDKASDFPKIKENEINQPSEKSNLQRNNLITEGTLVKLIINENIENFNQLRIEEFTQKIKKLLDIDDGIEIIKIESGSVIVTLKLEDENAKKLIQLLATGSLEGFDIEKAELLNYEKESQGKKDNSKIIKSNSQPLIVWKKHIKESIAKNDLNKVFEEIKYNFSPEESTYDEAINLEARYNENLKTERIGVEDKKNIEIEFNSIRNSMLSMVNNISTLTKKNKKHFR